MDMLLGGLAFAAIILGQFAAVIAVHGGKWSCEPETLDAPQARTAPPEIAQLSVSAPL